MALEQYLNVVHQPVRLRYRRGVQRVRRNKDFIEDTLRSESPRLLELAQDRGFLSELDETTEKQRNTDNLMAGDLTTDAPQASMERDRKISDDDGEMEEGLKHRGDADPDTLEISRTDAEKHFDEVAQAREQERLRRIAGLSYKEQVDNFNKKLAREPEHFDLFKVSHTK